jgi:hypothetical protein
MSNDPDLTKAVIGKLPGWGPACVRGLLDTLLSRDSPFPCTFAVAAARKSGLRFSFLDSPHDERAWAALPGILRSYLDSYSAIVGDTSLVVFFRPEAEPLPLDAYWEQFWTVLRFLHGQDADPWPTDVPGDLSSPHWEFSFGGVPIFVVCNTPAHEQRRSRNSPGMMITFQPRPVFDGVGAGTPRGEASRRTIRARIRRYDGMEPAAALGGYGEPGNSEWRQYFLPDTDSDPMPASCPFPYQERP